MMFAPSGSSSTDSRQVHLRLLATSDLHMHLLPFDYARNRPSARIGLTRTAGLIAAARAEARNVLLFDNGDFLQGNPMADLAAGEDGPHPATAAMNALGYDAATLGNHEFNYGLPVLMRALAGLNFPVVSANAAVVLGDSPGRDRTLVAPWTVLLREVVDFGGRAVPLRVGVIGLVPPQVAVWDRDHVAGRVWFRDMIDTAAARVPELRAAGADVVVALAHTGIGDAVAVAGMENAALPLARVPGIDVLVTGHSHLVFPSPRFAGMAGVDVVAGLVEGKPAVMPGAFGSHLGVVDLLLEPAQGGGWRVAASSVAARPIARAGSGGRAVPLAAPVPAVALLAAAAHDRTRAWVARRVGRTDQRLSSHFALVSDTAAFRLIAEAKAAHVRDRMRGTVHDGVPVLGSASAFRTGGRGGPRAFIDIPAGPVTARHVADLYPFPNALRAVLLDGTQLRAWLEKSVALYHSLRPGDTDVPLFCPEVPGYTLNLIAGVRFEIRLDRPVGERIHGLRHAGRPVDAEDPFIIATSSYRAAVSAPEAPVVLAEPVLIGTLVERHLAARGARRQDLSDGWRLILPQGASATFDSAPNARALAVGGLDVTDLGLTPAGFRRFRLASAVTKG